MGRWWIRGLEMRVGWECSISRGEADCTVEVYMSEKSEEEVTVLRVRTWRGVAPRVRASKTFEFGEGEL